MSNPVALIKSTNPRDRVEGIKLLAQMHDDDKALKILMHLYKTDENPTVRDAAHKAASHIARLRKAQAAPSPAKPQTRVASAPVDEQDYPEEAAPVEVSEKDRKRAKGYIDEALDYQMSNDREKMVKALSKALKADPSLKKDSFFGSLAVSATGMGTLEAIAVLENEDKRKELIDAAKRHNQQEEIGKHLDAAKKYSWGNITIDMILFAVIVFAGALLFFLVMNFGIGYRLTNINNQLNPPSSIPVEERPVLDDDERASLRETREILQELQPVFTPLLAIFGALAFTLAIVPSVLVFAWVAHPIAKNLFKGNGSASFLMYNVIQAYNRPMIGMFGVMFVGAVLMFMAGLPVGIGFIIIGGAMGLANLIASLSTLGALSKTYRFSIVSAILTSLVAGIPTSIILSIMSFIGSLLIGGAVAALMGTGVIGS